VTAYRSCRSKPGIYCGNGGLLARAVRQLVPGNLDVLKNPIVASSFLTDFLGR
jgi:hypothetical protein